MKRISLNGEYRLSFGDEQCADAPMQTITAQVPGNVELDMMRAGLLPDVFFGENIRLLRPLEFYTWIYEREFEAPELEKGERAYLHFGGVDCVADYELNGQPFGYTENALIDHRFDVTGLLNPGLNQLKIQIHSPLLYAADQDYEALSSAMAVNYESLKIRKAPACYGWDIMPRCLSAGLWREVNLEIEGPNQIESLFLMTPRADEKSARIMAVFKAHTNAHNYEGMSLKIQGFLEGKLGFEVEKPIRFPAGRLDFEIQRPALWWPKGYGAQNLYEIRAQLMIHGQAVDEYKTTLGIRTVELVRSEITDAHGGEFHFLINGVKVFCKGSNWVPADAFHSRDQARYERMLDLFSDTNCNILRAWGGNVYEDHAFFDLCDRKGIMVWQDFAMACATYPLDEEFLSVMRQEAESVVAKLRQHPSLILWSGDNECDQFAMNNFDIDPGKNRLTREILPQVVHRLDPYRPYLASSPYVSQAVWATKNERLLPENHLWGPRDYYKSSFYTESPAHFVSETGYHGCNSLSSIKGFISPEKLWPWQDNAEWLAHAYEPIGPEGPYAYRIKLMADQTVEMFGRQPETLEDFILASQISQAEAKKFFIELTRYKKWRRCGVIWWNMIDGWPQFSDAVVSYDFIKKLAYYYIKRVQQDLCLMFDEIDGWHIRLYASNDTLQPRSGNYRVWDADSGETLLSGTFEAPANESVVIDSLRVSHGQRRLLLMEWESQGVKGVNHYLMGRPPFDFEQYKKWLHQIAQLDGSFDADEIGR